MNRKVIETAGVVTEAIAPMNTPFDAFKVSRAAGISAMDAARELAELARTGSISPLGESPEGEPSHICERYIHVATKRS